MIITYHIITIHITQIIDNTFNLNMYFFSFLNKYTEVDRSGPDE